MKRKTMDDLLIREQEIFEEMNSRGLSERSSVRVGWGEASVEYIKKKGLAWWCILLVLRRQMQADLEI